MTSFLRLKFAVRRWNVFCWPVGAYVESNARFGGVGDRVDKHKNDRESLMGHKARLELGLNDSGAIDSWFSQQERNLRIFQQPLSMILEAGFLRRELSRELLVKFFYIRGKPIEEAGTHTFAIHGVSIPSFRMDSARDRMDVPSVSHLVSFRTQASRKMGSSPSSVAPTTLSITLQQPTVKPPLRTTQNFATQMLQDENPDKFILSSADQQSFRKLFPIRKPLLPERSAQDRRPTLVLDLDETLIHTTFDIPAETQEYESVNMTLLGSTKSLYVNKRPWVKPFLKAVAQWYEVVIYTASLSPYANSILDTLDPTNEIFSHRLFRGQCSFFKGVYIKDLESLGRPLDRTVFVDNFPGAYMMQPSNALPVRSFVGNTYDNELLQLMKLLRILRFKDDVRPLLRRYQMHWKKLHFDSNHPKSDIEG